MEITKEVVTTIKIDKDTVLRTGDKVKFIANNCCQYGAFVGLTKRGDMAFESDVADTNISFNVRPSSISAIEKV